MYTLYSMQSSGIATRCACCSRASTFAIGWSRPIFSRAKTAPPISEEKSRLPCAGAGVAGWKVSRRIEPILVYLAEGTPYLPADRLERAEVLRWMFFELQATSGDRRRALVLASRERGA